MPTYLVLTVILIAALIKWLGWLLLVIVAVAAFVLAVMSLPENRRARRSHGALGSATLPPPVPQIPIRINVKSVTPRGDIRSNAAQRVASTDSHRPEPAVALIVNEEPLERILQGAKTWEMRSNNTRKRETIALAKKGSGHIFGLADIVDSRGPLSDADMLAAVAMHQIKPSRLSDPKIAKYRSAWVLANVRRLRQPVPYVHTKGAQSFVNLDASTAAAVNLAANGSELLGKQQESKQI